MRAQGFLVLVVDDGSSDQTVARASSAGAEVIVRPANGGKGTALREGLAALKGRGQDWVLMMDADGQHLPSEISRFLIERDRGGSDLILGSRMDRPRGMPLDRRLTNRLMSWLISWMAGQGIPDSQCGFRLASRTLLERLRLNSLRFEIESEMAVKAAWAGFRISSVPVSSVYRGHASFIRPIRDTWRFLLFLWRLRREKPGRLRSSCS